MENNKNELSKNWLPSKQTFFSSSTSDVNNITEIGNKIPHIFDLPKDILVEILFLLNARDFASLARVAKRFYYVNKFIMNDIIYLADHLNPYCQNQALILLKLIVFKIS